MNLISLTEPSLPNKRLTPLPSFHSYTPSLFSHSSPHSSTLSSLLHPFFTPPSYLLFFTLPLLLLHPPFTPTLSPHSSTLPLLLHLPLTLWPSPHPSTFPSVLHPPLTPPLSLHLFTLPPHNPPFSHSSTVPSLLHYSLPPLTPPPSSLLPPIHMTKLNNISYSFRELVHFFQTTLLHYKGRKGIM